MRRRYKLHGICEREDRERASMGTLDKPVRDNTDEFVHFVRHFTWLDDVTEGSRAKVDGVAVRVEAGRMEVVAWVREGLAAIDMYTDCVASGILPIWHCESGGMTQGKVRKEDPNLITVAGMSTP